MHANSPGEDACQDAEEGDGCEFEGLREGVVVLGSCHRPADGAPFCAHKDWSLKFGGNNTAGMLRAHVARTDGDSYTEYAGGPERLDDDRWHLAVIGWDGGTLFSDIDGAQFGWT